MVFNPSDGWRKASDNAFHEEYFTNRNALLEELGHFGEHDDSGEKDFNIGLEYSHERCIYMSITSEKMLSLKVLQKIQEVICKWKEEYEVHVEHEQPEEGTISHYFIQRDCLFYCGTDADASILNGVEWIVTLPPRQQ